MAVTSVCLLYTYLVQWCAPRSLSLSMGSSYSRDCACWHETQLPQWMRWLDVVSRPVNYAPSDYELYTKDKGPLTWLRVQDTARPFWQSRLSMPSPSTIFLSSKAERRKQPNLKHIHMPQRGARCAFCYWCLRQMCPHTNSHPSWPWSAVHQVRLSALMDLYIHPLKGIFHPSQHKIYSFSASIHLLYHPLSTVGFTCHFI
jgi:hypothetical protein